VKGNCLVGLALLVLLLPVSTLPVLATEVEKREQELQYIVGEKYKVTIPTTITLTDQAGTKGIGTAEIKLETSPGEFQIPPDKLITIALTQKTPPLMLHVSGSEGLPYTIKRGSLKGNQIFADGISFFGAPAGTTTGVSQILYFETTGNPRYAGTYTDVLNFTIGIDTSLDFFEVDEIAAGKEFDFAGATWRILAEDMDPNVLGNQALIIRITPLTNAEAKGVSDETAADNYQPYLRDSDRYFDSTSPYGNGYDAGTGNTNYLKGGLDYYYEHHLANVEDNAKYVNYVSLNNPTYDQFAQGKILESNSTGDAPPPISATNWKYGNFCNDTNFNTTMGGIKQAFALSYGDINTTIGLSFDSNNTNPLLKLGTTDNDYFLRSAGSYFRAVGIVKVAVATTASYKNSFRASEPKSGETLPLPNLNVYPALSLNIKQKASAGE
jgi:hypothetical protein